MSKRTYYIDPKDGDDANDGLTNRTAIRTEDRMVALWRTIGPAPIIQIIDDWPDKALEARMVAALERAGFKVPESQEENDDGFP